MQELIKQAPYLAALVFIVVVFVNAFLGDRKSRERESKRRDEVEIARIKEIERVGDRCHEHTRELNKRAVAAIDNASKVIETNTKVIGAIEERLNGRNR